MLGDYMAKVMDVMKVMKQALSGKLICMQTGLVKYLPCLFLLMFFFSEYKKTDLLTV